MSEPGVIPRAEERRLPDDGHEVGTVTEGGGTDRKVTVGVNYEFVCITISGRGTGPQTVVLNAAEREEFSRLYFEAERQAEATVPP